MNPAISIVIPVYNVKSYIRQCVDSVLNQSFTDCEVILVDDGSTDGCGGICDQYAQKDSMVKVIHKQNGGLMSAVRAGIAAARGEYIGFVDSDDWIDRDMYERLYQKAKAHNADIVCCEYIKEYPNHSAYEKRTIAEGLYDKADIAEIIFPVLINDSSYMGRQVTPGRVVKLYRLSTVLNNLEFYTGGISYGEDLLLTLASFCDARRVYMLPEYRPYHYRYNAASITGKYEPCRWQQVLTLNSKLRQIAAAKGVYDFEPQIKQDLISLAVNDIIYNEFSQGSKRAKMQAIREICGDRCLAEAFEGSDISGYSLRYRVAALLLKKKLCGCLCLYGRMFEALRAVKRGIARLGG